MDQVIQFEGTIYENGYGLLAQKVMRDKNLPKQSKLIYAYMCSFAGIDKQGERTAFPSIELQCGELGMSEDTYYKWRKPLIQAGYIKISKQRKKNAKFDRNIYSIIAVPKEEVKEEKEKKPYPNSSGTEENPSNQDFEPYPNSSGTENPSTENKGTNSNSTTSNIKELDTRDTEDTARFFTDENNLDPFSSQAKEKEQERIKKRNEYMENAFYNNDEFIPEEIAEMLKVFCRTTDEAKRYYDIILIAKNKAEKESHYMIWLEHEHELMQDIIQSFSRAIRKIEKERHTLKNPDGYLFTSIYEVIRREIQRRYIEEKIASGDSNFYNWLEEDEEQTR